MGNAKIDLLVVILLLFALGVAWVWTGGPSRTISHQGAFLSLPAPFGKGSGIIVPQFNLSGAQTSSSTTSGTPQSSQQTDTQTASTGVLGGITDPTRSPYAESVRIQIGNAQASDVGQEYIVIQTSKAQSADVTMTGWTLESTANNVRVSIPQAAAIPYLGNMNSSGPVTVGAGSDVVVTTGHAPNGTSFRVNMCTGYFGQYQNFVPPLPRQCPMPTDEAARFPQKTSGNQACTNFIRGLSQCSLAGNTTLPGNIGSSCQDFVLNNLSYNGCVATHQTDPNFYRNEWRIFLNRDQELWQNTHDRILLLDENGKLISSVSY